MRPAQATLSGGFRKCGVEISQVPLLAWVAPGLGGEPITVENQMAHKLRSTASSEMICQMAQAVFVEGSIID
jgi:hypothetical protein